MNWWLGLGLGETGIDDQPFDATVLIPFTQRKERLEWRRAHKQPCRIKRLLVESAIVEIKDGWTTKVHIGWIWGYCSCERPYGCKCGAMQKDKHLRKMERLHARRISEGYGTDYATD